MSYSPFKEVTVANPGSDTRYGSDDILEVMKIFNAKVVSNKRPEIINPWRWSSWQELKQITEASVTTPSEANVAHLFLSATDNKLKIKKTGGTIINLEDIGSGTWSPTGTETVSNKTINVDQNTVKHSTTNTSGDILKGSGTSYQRFTKGSANQVLAVNAAGTDIEWQTPVGGGGGGETNTASNVGSAGIGTFYQKLGVDLQFKSIFSPDASVNISDDTGNQKIDLTLPAGIVRTAQGNTFGDFQQTFRSSRLAITNPANTFAYFLVGSALTASRNMFLPLLTTNDTLVSEAFIQTLSNKTMGTGTIANTDTITLKHSTTNAAGELMRNTGTKFDRFAKGSANTFLKVNASGTDIEWGALDSGWDADAVETLTNKTVNVTNNTLTATSRATGDLLKDNGTKYARMPRGTALQYLRTSTDGLDLEWGTPSGGGPKLPDASVASSTSGRWGAFYGGSGNGMGMMGFDHTYTRLHGSTSSSSESFTDIYTAATSGAIAEFKTAAGFRRDSTCVFKAKWKLTSSATCKVKVGLSNATSLPAGGGGTGGGVTTIRYDVTQDSADHYELAAGLSRLGVRFNSGAAGLGEAVTEVLVRFRKYGTPSGSATVGIRKNSDGTLVSLGTFTPNSFGSGEQVATISAAGNTYAMLANDRVSVEFPGDDSDGIELDEDDTGGHPTGFQGQEWNGSTWSNTTEALGLRIKTTTLPSGGGTNGDLPLANASGIMVHGTIGTHTNYRIARNSGAASQTEEDSTKALANTTAHTLEIQINSTNCVVILDGTTFTYTTTIPATTTDLAWYMHIESATTAEKGLSIAYAQVVVTS